MIPLKDENPRRSFPIVNYVLIGINIIIFFYEMSLGRGLNYFFLKYGLIPYEITRFKDIPPFVSHPVILNIFTSMFLHGSFMHIAGNMLYLYIFGDNVEDALGHIRYFFFYILSGIGAALAQIIITPSSLIPNIGASGAISGVLGAYVLLYPHARVITLIPDPFTFGLFYRLTKIPALFFIGFWFILQFFQGILTLPYAGKTGGVAWWAHIGGFITGIILVLLYYSSLTGMRRYRRL